jgi:hypothetical protein
MRNHARVFLSLIIVMVAGLVFCGSMLAQTIGISDAPNSKSAGPAPKRDVSGVWAHSVSAQLATPDGVQSPGGDRPPMTPWAQAKYDAEKPGYGTKAAPGGNDPILQCDPNGFPRILYFPTPYEFAQIPGRVLQFFERDHMWREIWTDGRSFPKDLDPTWYGYSVGKWMDDYTLVVETEGLDDRTWLGQTGYPHSDSMHVEERYHRTDHDNMELNVTMTDPVAYTKPWVAAMNVLKLQPKSVEIPQYFCVWSEENAFAQKIRAPAAVPTGDQRPRDAGGHLR